MVTPLGYVTPPRFLYFWNIWYITFLMNIKLYSRYWCILLWWHTKYGHFYCIFNLLNPLHIRESMYVQQENFWKIFFRRFVLRTSFYQKTSITKRKYLIFLWSRCAKMSKIWDENVPILAGKGHHPVTMATSVPSNQTTIITLTIHHNTLAPKVWSISETCHVWPYIQFVWSLQRIGLKCCWPVVP